VKRSDEVNSISNTLGFDNLGNPTNVEIAATEDQRLYLVWQDNIINTTPSSKEEKENEEEILFSESVDQDNSFKDILNLSVNMGMSECPSIAMSGETSIPHGRTLALTIMKFYK
jgi:hypothetical protein